VGVRPDANRRMAMADLKAAELGACRCGGHEAGRQPMLLVPQLVIRAWAALHELPYGGVVTLTFASSLKSATILLRMLRFGHTCR
jgi:hypothetical protein